MILIKGTRTIPITTDEFFVRCPCCEADSLADALVLSKYFHLYWIPIIPVGIEVTLICIKCGLKRPNMPFDAKLVSNYQEIKSKFKHPYFSWLGILIITVIIIGSIVASMV